MEEFQVKKPSPLLAPYVKQYWFLKTSDLTQPNQRIIPTGSTSIVFHRASLMLSTSQGSLQPQAFISGQSVGYTDLVQTGAVDMICVVFQPHGAKAFFSMPISEFHDATIAVNDMSDVALRELQDQLLYANSNQQCVNLIEEYLYQRLSINKGYNYQRMAAAIQAVTLGENSIDKLSQICCLSYKQFKRIFSEYVGANPKDFLRIIRFQRALYTLQCQPQISLAQLAYECGFYDQSHLIKEFKIFSGYTPSEYVAACAPYSDYFS